MAGTRWVKIDTSYLRNPKITAISAQAVLLHLASICWTADQLTDGQILRQAVPELAQAARIGRTSIDKRIDEQVGGGLWIPNGKGWELHDFDVMNPQALRDRVERQRRAWRDAKGMVP